MITFASRGRPLCAMFALLLAIAPQAGYSAESAGNKVAFNSEIRPIFNNHCLACHGGVKQAAGISFIRRATALASAESGEIPIVPGDPDKSELIRRITSKDDDRMPPAEHGRALSENEIATIRKWIEQGADWQDHWAYVAPVKRAPPAVQNTNWCLQPMDQFVLARLEAEGKHPAAEGDRRAWLRRVSFDLTGLPPTHEEIAAFLADRTPEAWATVVDRLLASPAYGERWTSLWLDLARYADTVGFERDPARNAWPYRDWLIRALNADMPFDEFTIKQLAGDLIENPSLDDLVATMFHRNTQTNTEGGTDDEEFRVQAVIDRVNTTWQVWQATTFGCTQCHAHPYAPFDNDEYYKFMAFFNKSRDCDLIGDHPLLSVPLDESKKGEAQEIDRQASALKQRINEPLLALAARPEIWLDLPLKTAEATSNAKLKIVAVDGRTEFRAEGTIANHPVYTLVADFPENASSLAALRIDVFPLDLQEALKTPEAGFVLSLFQAEVLTPNEKKPRPIEFDIVFADEADPSFDPEASLRKDPQGWSSLSRIHQPRFAVFVPKSPVEIKPGDQLRLTINQDVVVDGSLAMFIRRACFSISTNESWNTLHQSAEFIDARKSLAELRAKREKIKHIDIPTMRELSPGFERHTYQFERGNWLVKGKEVLADTPSVLPPLPADAKRDRLAVARWLVSAENPMTARVIVNRLWAELFGRGIVETAEDFGSSGTPPSHPELLDDLAIRFRTDFKWSMKKLLRELVLSATYRQDAHVTAELRSSDPSNRLLERGPRNRLAAEMVRDQSLLAAGVLSHKMYGPPVMPPQPDGIWRSVYSGATWVTATGEDRFRRGVYTYWKRTSGYPSFLAFDAPSRDVCAVRRISTNTPLQALATLNDEAYIEFARALGKRMHEAAGSTMESEFAWAHEATTTQIASAATIEDLSTLYREALAAFQADLAKAKKLGDSAEEAARTIVANAILNLDGALIK